MAGGQSLDLRAPYLPLSAHPFAQLEKGLGSRPQLAAIAEVDIPVFNGMAEQLAAGWPELEVDLITGLLQPSSALRGLSPCSTTTWQARPGL